MKNIQNMNTQGGRGSISLNPINALSNENGAIVTGGSILSLSEANQFYGGVLSVGDQTFGGEKTFANTANFDTSINLASDAYITQNNQLLMHTTPYSNANMYLGSSCGNLSNTGFGNLGIGGFHSLQNVTTGQDNTCAGTRSGQFVTTGDRNTLLGFEAGLNLSTENNNLFIDNKGVTGDNNCIKIGEYGTHNRCYLQGITGSTGTDQMVCVTPATGKLGSQPILSMGAIGGTPNANAATISSQVLSLQPASASFPGVVTNGTQSFSGDKSFNSNVGCSGTFSIASTSNSTQGSIFAGGNRFISRPGNQNTFLGVNSGNFTGTIDNNVGIGYQALQLAGTVASSGSNIGIGTSCLGSLAQGNQNIAVGNLALSGLTGGNGQNCCLGDSVAVNLKTGARNVMLGRTSGSTYTSNESDNILFSNTGVIGDTGTIRIGNAIHNTCAISGISGKTSTSGVAVLVNSSGILGTTTSSQRWKENIQPLDASVAAKLEQMRVVSFNYKDDKTKKIQYGMIAEEVLPIMPEICVFDNDDPNQPVNTIQYHILVPLLVKELQVQKARIDQLEQLIGL